MTDSDDGYEDIPDNLQSPLRKPINSSPSYDILQKSNSPAASRSVVANPPPIELQPPLPPPNSVPKRPPKPPITPSIGREPPTPPPPINEPIPTDEQSYTILPDELTLTNLVEKHQDLFPIRVHVCKGFYGSTERSSVSEGDIYNIHFVKKAKVVIVRDCSKVDYRIALNSSVEFGVLHNPEGNIQKALDGYKYPKVSDIMAISPLPKVIRATLGFKGTAVDNSVEKNEIFIIREIKPKGNRKCLIVYSVTNSMIKYLFESCEGHFSTKPYDVRLFLPEILEHFPQPFPTMCYLFVNSETSQELPHHLTSSAVTILGESTDLSLIASSNCQVEAGRPLLVEIPIDLDIEVQLTQPKDETDNDQLYETTNDLMKNFDLSKVVKCTEGIDMMSTLTTPLQPGEKKGIELVESTAMRHWSTAHTKMPVAIATSNLDYVINEVEQPPPTTKSSVTPQNAPNPPIAPKPSIPTTPTNKPTMSLSLPSADLTSVRADMKRLDMRLSKDLESLKDMVTKLTQSVEHVVVQGTVAGGGARTQPSTPTGRKASFSARPSDPPAQTEAMSRSMSVEVDASVRQQNILFLRTLDTVNLVRLLKAMGLEQYSQSIAQEHITGDVLLECTEGILEKELKIASKLHRVRLMKLIDGSHSAKSILTGEGPYGSLTQ